MPRTKKSEPAVTAEDVVYAFKNLLDLVNAYGGGAAPEKSSSKKAAAEEVTEVLDREEVENMGIKELRSLAAEHGIDAKKKADIFEAFESAGLFGEAEAEDEDEDEDEDDDEDEAEDDEDEEEEDEEEEDEYDRDELEEMTLAEVRKIAKGQGIDTKGLDQDALIDAILGENEDEEDEDEEEADTEELDEDALRAMSLGDLKSLAKELEIKVKVPKSATSDKKKKEAYVEAILDSGEEVDD